VKRALGLTGHQERQRKAERFRRERLRLSSETYLDAASLHRKPPVFEAYVVGSDQVWNPLIQRSDPAYFLDFAPPGKKRISYAASFGLSVLPEEYIDAYRTWLVQFDCLSTREYEGQRIIKQITGRDAELTLDPTLLLNNTEWSDVLTPYAHDRPYILCYSIWAQRSVEASIVHVSRRIADLTGWDIVMVVVSERIRFRPGWRRVVDAGPSEFLGLLKDAAFVVTDSFHGTALAIGNSKPFVAIVDRDLSPVQDRSSRITTLLRLLGLEHRILPAGTWHVDERVLELDYGSPSALLQSERRKSIDFLVHALGGL